MPEKQITQILKKTLVSLITLSTIPGCVSYEHREKYQQRPSYQMPSEIDNRLVIPPGMLVDPKVKLITHAYRSQYL